MRSLTLFLLSLVLLLASCSQSSDVVQHGLWQKRKYRKGWHVNDIAKHKEQQKKGLDRGQSIGPINFSQTLQESDEPEVYDHCTNQSIETKKPDPKFEVDSRFHLKSKRHRTTSKKFLSVKNHSPPDEDKDNKSKRLIIASIGSLVSLFAMLITLVLGSIIGGAAFLPSFMVILWLGLTILAIIYAIDLSRSQKGKPYLTDERLTDFGLKSKRLAILSTTIILGVILLAALALVIFFVIAASVNTGNIVGLILLGIVILFVLALIVSLATIAYIVLSSIGLAFGIASYKHNQEGKNGTWIIVGQLALQFLLFIASILLVLMNVLI